MAATRAAPGPLHVAAGHQVLAGLLAVDMALVAAYLLLVVFGGGDMKLFDLNRENNIPSWWSAMQLLLAGQLFGITAWQGWRLRREWLPLAAFSAVLVFLSMDEDASVHEAIGYRIDQMVGGVDPSLARTGLWFIVLGLPFLIGMIWLLFRMASQLGQVPGTRLRLFTALLCLLAGAIGVEGAANLIVSGSTAASRVGYRLSVALEEGAEMAGGSLFVWAGLLFLLRHPDMQAALAGLGRNGRRG